MPESDARSVVASVCVCVCVEGRGSGERVCACVSLCVRVCVCVGEAGEQVCLCVFHKRLHLSVSVQVCLTAICMSICEHTCVCVRLIVICICMGVCVPLHFFVWFIIQAVDDCCNETDNVTLALCDS